ncbi:MAG: hypothetical protein SFX18_13535 [Pirellulales bacterium]|nr:hypothetical protein [Pirellulales bacterium]
MANSAIPTQFTAKTWIYSIQLIVFGGLAAFCFLFGPLFLFGYLKRADGKSAFEAGIALSVMSLPFLLVAALAAFNLLARRRPLIRICQEGIEINLIGSSSLDNVPYLPGLVRVLWLVFSLQGFRQQLLISLWESLHQSKVSGPPMARTLTLIGAFYRQGLSGPNQQTPVATRITFPEVAFARPLHEVASALRAYCQNSELRSNLPHLSR